MEMNDSCTTDVILLEEEAEMTGDGNKYVECFQIVQVFDGQRIGL